MRPSSTMNGTPMIFTTTVIARTSRPRRPATRSDRGSRLRRLVRRLGVAGFLFFLVKGLLWLLVPAALWALHG
jgi:hypothetical protein